MWAVKGIKLAVIWKIGPGMTLSHFGSVLINSINKQCFELKRAFPGLLGALWLLLRRYLCPFTRYPLLTFVHLNQGWNPYLYCVTGYFKAILGHYKYRDPKGASVPVSYSVLNPDKNQPKSYHYCASAESWINSITTVKMNCMLSLPFFIEITKAQFQELLPPNNGFQQSMKFLLDNQLLIRNDYYVIKGALSPLFYLSRYN